jgi:hypothetical protein
MRAELIVANTGFILHVNEYDICRGAKVLFLFAWFWRRAVPRGKVELLQLDKELTVDVTTYGTNGSRVGWRLRGPVERTSY